MSSSSVDISLQEDHPDFVFDDADLVLLSCDGTRFHVHSLVLKLASSVFSDMITVGRSDGDRPVVLAETKTTLSILLDLLYPTRMPPSAISLTDFRSVAVAAEKYDMPRVTTLLKDIILGKSSSIVLDDDETQGYTSIKAYLMASDLGWSSIADEISSRTLSCDLNSDVAQNLLYPENSSRSGVRELIWLHRERRIWIYNALLDLDKIDRKHLGSITQYEASNTFLKSHNNVLVRPLTLYHKADCTFRSVAETWYRTRSWWEFKAKISSLLEVNASGDQLLTEELYGSDEVRDLMFTKCCSNYQADNLENLTKSLRNVVEKFPRTIEGFRSLGRSPAAANLRDERREAVSVGRGGKHRVHRFGSG